ncbi:AAA family ATPase [Epilithonimonas ginsengisoli]|uniref:AAA family ATPase n=1 Tax=Epilithonimonas ginsengisoli TaxID=1245592 RepID=A0ABU4JMD3_9FLAO|nr:MULTISPECIES: AAA family ATPase [Chryseobacterium group]MBV6878889.1 AAA family ATPase [Epilithonimonas sp. FP105]MDW8550859.1 AAA family ATPase [Epilithonimonas ginsengisoli]OAH71837.1 hypothetical protein AXA65_11490 [Chryseobacterium sp. FP211-J200]
MIDNKSINTLIERYSKIIKVIGEPKEIYKYDAISEFQENWDIDANDFATMFKKSISKVSNLLYQNSWGFIISAVEHFPIETREMFENLYNENISLEERIFSFQTASQDLLESLKEILNRDNFNAQQDERTISVYLGFRYPEIYTFYKFSYFSEFCKEFNIDIPRGTSKYLLFQEISKAFRTEIESNENFQTFYRSFYPKPMWDDTNLMIQNVLFLGYKEDVSGLYKGVLDGFSNNDLASYFNFLDVIIENFKLKKGSQKIVFNVSQNQLNFTIGQKYIWCIKSNISNRVFKIIADKEFSSKTEKFKSSINSYLNHFSDLDNLSINEDSIFQAISEVISKTIRSSYLKFNNQFIERLAFDKTFRNLVLNIQIDDQSYKHQSINNMNFPLNQILYGPPGTGKTYHTITKAIGIANPNFNIHQDREIIKDEYNRLVETGQIVFTTFHQSMSYEDFIEGIKPVMTEDEGEVNYEIQNGIFKEICKTASEVNEITVVDNFEDSWGKLIEVVKENIADDKLVKIGSWEYGLSTKESLKYSSLNSPSQYTFTITKQNILDTYQNKQARPSGAFQKDMEDVVNYMKANLQLSDYRENNDKNQNRSKERNYVLIIDEINRGNVSQIFGELITLIEESKRLGNPEELEITLPYSKNKFGVPSNLYIIGTMNTADRSVEALDTALRRRFSFVEMMPDSNVVEEGNFQDYHRVGIMEKMNQRIELLLDKNYTLGHSYFIKDDFKASFKNEIIPLLQEYFYNDCGKIGLVLGKGFVREKEISKVNQKNVFADFDTRNDIDVIKSYELIPFDEVDFQDAIDLLLA